VHANGKNDMNHIEIKQMVAYVAGRLKRSEASEVKAHLESCAECKRRVDAHHYIRNNFDKVWDSWISRNRPGDLIAERVARALSQGLENPVHQGLIDKMESWLKRVRANAGIAWCVAVSSAGKAVRVVRERLEELSPLVSSLHIQPVALATRGAVRTRGAVSTKGDILQTSGAASPKTTLSAQRLESDLGTTIRVTSPMLKDPWPLVMLIPEAGGEAIVGEFRATPDGLLAEFKGLPKADYMIVVEGLARKKASPR
jgi:hypothetical protein